ncbi:MAG: proline--tRNA ligase [Candidatus Parcubacteria bacterium]|nr:MAG: proline--tRNA ligase [Candidatus Parcubacteria bacterium]
MKEENFSDWYLKTIFKNELADYGPVKGTIIFKPYGYRIWEKIQKHLDEKIKKIGGANVYFPLFIPESFFAKEKEHLEGFSPEVAVVSYAGGEELNEKLIVRPTSETIMYPLVSEWIKSYRDLPLIINQWANVVRWEKRPFPFIRNTEFLWQEGHSFHADHRSSLKMVFQALSIYENIYQKLLAIYGVSGQKSESEKFAGALATYTYEVLMPDGKALQGCTSHDLGQNFAKVFSVRFQDKNEKLKYVWQTSWGFTTRSLGAIIAVHGDEKGLVLPPAVAPYQFVIIPIYDKHHQREINKYIEKLITDLSAYDVYVDQSDRTPGYKFNHWEAKGIPLRLEIGYQEVNSGRLTCFRRDNNDKFKLTFKDLINNIDNIFSEINNNLLARSKKYTETNTFSPGSYQDFKKILLKKRGFFKIFWCEREECEKKIKEETKVTSRCLPLDAKLEKGRCIYCQKEAKHRWLFAQSY